MNPTPDRPVQFWPDVRPIVTAEEVEALKRAAAADGHQVLCPTHVVRVGGEIVGYGSICATPVVNVWLDSKRVKRRESLMLLSLCENLARDRRIASIVMPCAAASPFSPVMGALGFVRLGETVLWAKKL